MRSILIVAAAGISILLQPLPALAREVRRLKPSGDWVLEYADANCRLARHFGEGKDRVTLVIDMFEPGDSFRMILAGESTTPRRSYRPYKVGLRFGPNEAPEEVTGVPGTAGAQRIFIFEDELRVVPLTRKEKDRRTEAYRRGIYLEQLPIQEARERAATWLEINDVFGFDLVLETGPMAKPFGSLRTCAWDLVHSWGLDVPQQQKRTRRVFPTGTGWFSANDYPIEMLENENEAIVHVRIMVDEKGKPTSCHIQESTRPKAFDDVVCGVVLKRAKFTPALDETGKPIRSYYQQTVMFRIG